jgi:hypothetical protein
MFYTGKDTNSVIKNQRNIGIENLIHPHRLSVKWRKHTWGVKYIVTPRGCDKRIEEFKRETRKEESI